MRTVYECTRKVTYFSVFLVIVGIIALTAAAPTSAATGNGVLTVNNATCGGTGACSTKPQPAKWDVLPGDTIHLHIQALGGACSSGPFTGTACTSSANCSADWGTCTAGGGHNKKCSGKANQSCTTDTDCQPTGICSPSALECAAGQPTTVIVKGHGGSCSVNADCPSTCGNTGTGQCNCDTIDLSGGGGTTQVCEQHWVINTAVSADGQSIDACWTVDAGMCFTATVAYCGNVGLLASENDPNGSGNRSQSGLRAVAACSVAGQCADTTACFDGSDCQGHGGGGCVGAVKASAIEDCERELGSCVNEIGSFCCGLTQGAYGAPNGIANAPCSRPCNDPAGCGGGFIAASACLSCNVFTGDPNATTAGIHGTRAVTLDNQFTLISYLPSGGSAGCFKTNGPAAVGADTHYNQNPPAANDIPDLNPSKTASKGEGGGVLAGQAMATRLNSFLSSCPTPFGGSSTFTASGFGGFQIPADGALVCTRTSGGDKNLGNGDDVCRAFAYPSCTWGQTVGNVLAAANEYLATCGDALGCSALDLNVALTNANEEFDNCGQVIACPATQNGAGAFPCQ